MCIIMSECYYFGIGYYGGYYGHWVIMGIGLIVIMGIGLIIIMGIGYGHWVLYVIAIAIIGLYCAL